jgi:nitrite reductase/ring-hydroxylating ferredoxin subunit
MKEKILLGSLEEIADNPLVKYYEEIKDELIIFREADSKDIKIFSSICPHNGGPVNFTNGKLVCTWHNYSYDSATGVCNNNKSKIRLCKKDYVIDGDSIYLING